MKQLVVMPRDFISEAIGHGDEYVRLQVKIPEKLSHQQKEALKILERV